MQIFLKAIVLKIAMDLYYRLTLAYGRHFDCSTIMANGQTSRTNTNIGNVTIVVLLLYGTLNTKADLK